MIQGIKSNIPEELNGKNNDEGLMDMDQAAEYLNIKKVRYINVACGSR